VAISVSIGIAVVGLAGAEIEPVPCPIPPGRLVEVRLLFDRTGADVIILDNLGFRN
jgi:hypothetical protein